MFNLFDNMKPIKLNKTQICGRLNKKKKNLMSAVQVTVSALSSHHSISILDHSLNLTAHFITRSLLLFQKCCFCAPQMFPCLLLVARVCLCTQTTFQTDFYNKNVKFVSRECFLG